VAIGVFDGVKRSFVKPVDAQAEVPIINKRTGQVIALLPKNVQIMDLETYQTFEAAMPEGEIASKLSQGVEVEYWSIQDKIRIMRVK